MKLRIGRYAHMGFMFYLGMLFFAFSFLPQITQAQSFLGGTNGATLVLNPPFPDSHTQVTVSLDAYSLDTAGASIVWYVDGTEKSEYRDTREITLNTKGIGEKTAVRVTLSRSNAPTITSSVSITPASIDIILEADTYTPSFYKGKALPSSESNFRAIAVVHDNGSTADTFYTYTWSLGDAVLLGGPIRGKNVLDITMPRYDNKPLSVQVMSPNGDVIGKKSILLRSATPELHFYEHSPLRGLFGKEIRSPYTLIGEETTLYGEPYFINAKVDAEEADFKWEIDGAKAEHDPQAPNTITLRHVGGEGKSRIELSVITKTKIPQFIEKAFQIFFE